MPGLVDGKVALVTGAASGIGHATAKVFAREGAKVIVNDIATEGGEETVRIIKDAGGEATFIKADVKKATEVQELINGAVTTYGRLDCAFNNAGIAQQTALTTDLSEEHWDDVIDLNLKGIWLCMKYEIPQMLKQGGGAIVNSSSTMGIVAHPTAPAYVASKFGVIGLTKSAALGCVKEGIRVNAICPGNTDTPIFNDVRANFPEIYEALMAVTPIGRLASPEEIANAVIWLCSDAASFCTGHAMVVDGCYTIQ